MSFKFDMGQLIEIECSGERGAIVGRKETYNCEDSYKVEYQRADGVACKIWWPESSLIDPDNHDEEDLLGR